MKFVFEITIKSGATEEQYIEAWQKGSAIIQEQPGARGTDLHRKIGEEGTFLAIATWESKEARDKAMKALKNADEGIRAVLDKHEKLGDIRVIGAFEDAEWRV